MAAVRGFSLAKLVHVRISFSVFDGRATSAREFMRRVTASRLRETNPKCDVACEVKGDLSLPTVDVTFADGSKMHFDAADSDVLDMISQINLHAKGL